MVGVAMGVAGYIDLYDFTLCKYFDISMVMVSV